MSSLYAERVLVAPPRSAAAGITQTAFQSQLNYALSTLHFEQLSIARLFDARIAAAVTP